MGVLFRSISVSRKSVKVRLSKNLSRLRFTLGEKCPYLELFWYTFSCIRTEYGEMLRIQTFRISLYSVRMRKNKDQNNSEYGGLLRSVGSDIFARFSTF